MMKDKEYYLGLNYPILIDKIYDEGEFLFTASIKELPGLIVYGESLEEVYDEIELAKADWIEANLEWGREIKEPLENSLEEYSGKVTLRLPKSLHRDVKERSEIEGVSLNQTLVQLINDGLFKQAQNSVEQLAIQIENMTKQFSRTIEEKVSAPEQHFHYIVKNQSETRLSYKEQTVTDKQQSNGDNVILFSLGG
ncbi:toxin-antitoxin system HicB family antitoxin [Lactococcus laudensis]|uniref:Toxin-antitoxin system HicB family antitoxin n=1 Tax=Pseudolactococcus laudensis TaxID=1494461 RepID=A0A7V8N2S8_9LACT|nr:toxin-antitoxin system HicB family antitoxin [Lactococcus laudensis]MBA0017660.1 toxin-antitoxin system HicB family antitoxin [Lactococcus laudensis]MBW9282482.1 toxin-antitoxin system HicB family antitoxin [Lactococcus laudensis]